MPTQHRDLDMRQQQLLEQLTDVRRSKEQLDQQEEALVSQALAADISGTAIAEALGRARQVFHARYSQKDVGWSDIDDSELSALGARARTYANGSRQVGLVEVEGTDDEGTWRCIFDGRNRKWDTQPRGRLPDSIVARLEQAGVAAQDRAERRYAGMLKRQATITAGNIRVGRPPRLR